LKAKKEMQVATQKEVFDDSPSDSSADLSAMFDDVNSLPADDPLRMPANGATAEVAADAQPVVVAPKAAKKTPAILNLLPAKVLAAFRASGGANSGMPDAGDTTARLTVPKVVPAVQEKGSVVVDAGLRVPVPSFEGAALRTVVERADGAGLRVQLVGSGLAREQVPAAGTMVPAGTEIVVRFSR
jgi:cell division protein FtsI (penicillin-binding protein 3)